jgi:hypothetical protein
LTLKSLREEGSTNLAGHTASVGGTVVTNTSAEVLPSCSSTSPRPKAGSLVLVLVLVEEVVNVYQLLVVLPPGARPAATSSSAPALADLAVLPAFDPFL